MSNNRAIVAFLISPLAGGVVMSIPFITMFIFDESRNTNIIFTSAAVLITFGCVYIFSLLLGVPYYLLKIRNKVVTKRYIITSWAIIGVVSAIIVAAFDQKMIDSLLNVAFLILSSSISGTAIGVTFNKILFSQYTDSKNGA